MTREHNTLICIAEECSEVIKCITKSLRFGLDSEYNNTTNRHKLFEEICDLQGVIELAQSRDIIECDYDGLFSDMKIQKVLDHEELSIKLGMIQE